MSRINFFAFEGEQRSAAHLLDHNLIDLETHIRLLQQALALADYCDIQREPYRAMIEARIENSEAMYMAMDANRQFIEWKTLAMRDGAITIYNFAETKQAIEGLIGKCPDLLDKLDREAAAEASRLWSSNFAGYVHVRLNVAHSGKLFNAPGKWQNHTIPGTSTIIRTMVSDRTMTTSINNSMASYSLTRESVAALTAVKDAIYRAYEPVSDFSFDLPSTPEPETQPPQAAD